MIKKSFKKNLLTSSSVVALGALAAIVAPSDANAVALTAATAADTNAAYTYTGAAALTWSIAGQIDNSGITGSDVLTYIGSGGTNTLTIGNGTQAAILASVATAAAGKSALHLLTTATGAVTVAAAATLCTAATAGTSHGIDVDIASGLITNSGTITASGAATNTAIDIAGVTVAGIVNTATGTIQATGAATTAINVANSGVLTAGIVNSGTIRNTGAGLDAITFGNVTSASSTTNIIDNSGLISAGTTGQALKLDGTVTGTINNQATGVISSAGDSATGTIDVDGIITGAIANAGTISTNAGGIALDLGANVTLGVTNAATGSITATTGTGVNVSASTIGAVTNAGTIQSTGGTAFNVATGANVTTLTNTGLINDVTSGAALTFAGTSTSDVVNEGTISATTTGQAIVLTGGDDVTGSGTKGTVYNTGSISSVGGTGAITLAGALLNSGTFSATTGAAAGLYNAGTISETTGVAILMSDASTTNVANVGGTISNTTGTAAINLTANQGGTILNTGTVSTTTGAGINLTAGTTLATLKNTGVIQSTAGNALLVAAGAGGITTVTNSGTIKDTSTGAAIGFAGAAGAASAITNTGVISSAATATTGGAIVGTTGIVAATITNSAGGLITNTAAGGRAIVLNAASSTLGAITNAGTISASSNTGVAIDAATSTAATALVVTNTGLITGDVKLSGGTGSVLNMNAVNTSATSTTVGMDGNIVNAHTSNAVNFNQGVGASQYYGGTITGAAGLGVVTAQSGTTYLTSNTVSTSTSTGNLAVEDLTVDAGATLNLASATAGGSKALNAQARISDDVTANGVLGIGAYNSITAVDAINVGASGAIKIGVVGSTAGTYGTISGAALTVTSGGTIQIDPTGIGYIANGTTLDKVITATSSPTNFTAGTLTESTPSYIYSFSSVLDTDTFSWDVLVTRENSIGSAGTTVNSTAVGAALETIGASGDDNLDAIIDAVDGMSTAAEIDTAIATLNPDMSGSVNAAALDAADAGLGVVGNRMEQLAGISGTGVAAGGMSYNSGVWGEAFGSAADQGDRKGVRGYQADTMGFGVGGDTAIDDQTKVGASFAYANTDATSANGGTDIDSFQLAAYGTHDYGKWYADGLLGFTFNKFDTTRNVVVGSISNQAKGDFDGQQYTLKVGGGYKLDVEGGLNVTPVASLKYDYLEIDSYTETGSTANLRVDNDGIHSLQSDIGVKLNYPIIDGSVTYIPEISTSWSYDLIGDEQEATNNFTGASSTLFTTKGAKVAQNTFNVGLGLDVLAQDNVTVSFDYDWKSKEDYNAHSGAVKARFAF